MIQQDIRPMKEWGLGLRTEKPILIAGPCSAETEEQVLQTFEGVAKQGVHMLRAGIWKPRTRPNSFEGVGVEGLAWVKSAAKPLGLPVCIEVAKAEHVEQALRHDIDVLWIGARTTVNPFAVQEIADALAGTDIPVMVKNPINPDLGLWIGALERLERAGINKLAAIHRGFSMYDSHPYRNAPQWDIPIELRRRVRGLEIITDPSHIAGRRDLLQEISQRALDLNFDGFMIETHINPDAAWSDAKQQVSPDGLGELLRSVIKRESTTDDPQFINRLQALRKEIDKIDYQVLAFLAKRMEIAREIGKYKDENNIAILQLERWDEIFRTRGAKAEDLQVAKSFIEDFLNAIHKESIRQQTKLMHGA